MASSSPATTRRTCWPTGRSTSAPARTPRPSPTRSSLRSAGRTVTEPRSPRPTSAQRGRRQLRQPGRWVVLAKRGGADRSLKAHQTEPCEPNSSRPRHRRGLELSRERHKAVRPRTSTRTPCRADRSHGTNPPLTRPRPHSHTGLTSCCHRRGHRKPRRSRPRRSVGGPAVDPSSGSRGRDRVTRSRTAGGPFHPGAGPGRSAFDAARRSPPHCGPRDRAWSPCALNAGAPALSCRSAA